MWGQVIIKRFLHTKPQGNKALAEFFEPSSSMKKWFRNILGLVILTLLLLYLARNWEKLKPLLNLNLKQILMLYGLWFLVILSSACVVQLLLNGLKIKTHFWDMALLNHAALLLNYAPMKFGTLFRANYLKRHYGLGYTRFTVFIFF